MKSSTRYLLVCPLLAGLAVSSCLKLEVSPLQELGPLVASVPTTAQYRYRNTYTRGSGSFHIYDSVTCTGTLVAGSQKTVLAGVTTAYSAIQPGYYMTVDPGYCIAFSPVAGESYTIEYSPFVTNPVISSP